MKYEVHVSENKEGPGRRVLSQDTIPTYEDLLKNREGLLCEVCFLWPFERRWKYLEIQLRRVPKKGHYYMQMQLFGMDLLVCERPPIYITVFINQ